MGNVYELCRKTTNRGTFKTLYDIRLVDNVGKTLVTSKTRNGYLAHHIELYDAGGGLCGFFGPNRRVAASAHVLKSAQGNLISEIRHGIIQFGWGGRGFACVNEAGELICALAPGETTTDTIGAKIDAWSRDQLVLQRGGETLGYTGGKQTTSTGAGIGKLATELPGYLIKSFRNEILGQEVDWPETVAGRLTLNEAGQDIDQRLIMAILVFKLHYHDLRNA